MGFRIVTTLSPAHTFSSCSLWRLSFGAHFLCLYFSGSSQHCFLRASENYGPRLAARSWKVVLHHLWRLYIPSTVPINRNLFAWESASSGRAGYWGWLCSHEPYFREWQFKYAALNICFLVQMSYLGQSLHFSWKSTNMPLQSISCLQGRNYL